MTPGSPSSSSSASLVGSNLETDGQNWRLRMGATMLGVALALSVVMVQLDVDRLWRLALFVPFFFGAFGAWQGLYRTCPGLASKGCCERTGGGELRILDREKLQKTRRLGRKVMMCTFLTGVSATALVFFLP